MKIVEHTDDRGRKYQMKLPPEAEEFEAEMGILIGPPDVVDALELPEPWATKLHNQLYARGIFSYDKARNAKALRGAIMAVFKIDIQLLQQAFLQSERESEISIDNPNGREELSIKEV
jgi:hypothetical protein